MRSYGGLSAVSKRYAWTPERRAWLARQRAKGRTYASIAKEIGITEGAVRATAYRLGLMDSSKNVAKRPWTREELDTVERMLAEGRPYSAIAEELGRTVASVRGAGLRLGLRSKATNETLSPAEWEAVVRRVIDWVETERLTVLASAERLQRLGYNITVHALRFHMRRQSGSVKNQIYKNAARRRQVMAKVYADRRRAKNR